MIMSSMMSVSLRESSSMSNEPSVASKATLPSCTEYTEGTNPSRSSSMVNHSLGLHYKRRAQAV